MNFGLFVTGLVLRSEGKIYGNKYKAWVFDSQTSDGLMIEQIKKDLQIILDEMFLEK